MITIKKNFRVTLDFLVEINEINEEMAKESFKSFSDYEELIEDPYTWRCVKFEKNLLNLLLNAPQSLKEYLIYSVILQVDQIDINKILNGFNLNKEEDKIFLPLMPGLNNKDRKFADELLKEYKVGDETFRGSILPEIGVFYDVFNTKLKRFQIAEIDNS